MRQREEQRHVAIDAFFLQNFGGADAFPGRSDLYEDALASDAVLLVKGNKAAGLGDETLGIEGEAGVGLGRDASGNNLQNLLAELDQQVVHNLGDKRFAAEGRFPPIGNRPLDEAFVAGHLSGLQDERGVSGRVLRRKFFESGEVAGISDNFGVTLELIELVEGGRGFGFFQFGNGAHNLFSWLTLSKYDEPKGAVRQMEFFGERGKGRAWLRTAAPYLLIRLPSQSNKARSPPHFRGY